VSVSVAHSRVVYDALKACGIRVLSALPETWLVHLISLAEEDPEMILVRLAKEEEGVGISAGAHLAGVKSAMLMQNHGFLASINGIVSCAQLYPSFTTPSRAVHRVRYPATMASLSWPDSNCTFGIA
jgi:sulfopyruvate decarboxylase subunit alpha